MRALLAGLGAAVMTGCAGPPPSAPGAPSPAATATQAVPRQTLYFVEAGVPREFLFTTSLNPDCTENRLPRVTVVTPPQHGRIEVKEARAFPNFPRENPRSACNTRRVNGLRVTYVPDPGFLGADRFLFRTLEFSMGVVRDFNYGVLVRASGAPDAPSVAGEVRS